MQSVQTSLLPFAASRCTAQVPEGLSIKEIVDFLIPRQVRGLAIVVNINDEVVPAHMWACIKPKQHALVGVNVVPAGGGGGKKNPLTTILSIAVAIAAPYVAGAILGTGIIASTAAGAMAISGAVRIGISMIGYLAISMLSSTPKQSASVSESRTQFIEGASNAVNKFGVIPINLGVNRMFPPQAALPYTESIGKDQYVRQLFTYGYGNVLVSERKFGETNITEYDNIETEDKLNGDLSDGVALYANDVYQDGLDVTLSYAAGYVLRTTQNDADEASVDVTFANGLTEYSSKGNKKSRTVQFSVEYAPTGTSTWSNTTSGLTVSSQTLSVPAPVREGRYDFTNKTGIIVLNKKNGVAKIITNGVVPADNIRIGSYTTNLNRTVITLTDERASYIPGSIASGFGLSVSTTNIVVASGVLAADPFVVTDSTTSALRVFKRLSFPTRGKYDIRIKRLTADGTTDSIRDVATWTALRSVTHTNPVRKTNISGSAIRVKATDQLSGTVDRFNVILKTIVTYWDGSAWVTGVSSNPAALYRHVLQSPAFIKALDDSRIDLTKLEEWSDYCDDNDLTYNRIIDYETSIDDVLRDIAAAGMATPNKVNGIYSVIIDNERPTIKGMVTPRNSWGYKGNINYPEVPHALRVQFRNEDKGYELDERIVYSDGYDSSNATEFERLEFNSCTNSDLAWFYGRRYLATAILQPETHTFNMDWENLTFNRGDRVVFVNDAVLIGVGQARIKSLIDDGAGNTTGFVIDDTIEIPNSNQFGVRVRQNDATAFDYYSLSTVVGETSTFTLATPVLTADGPQVGSLCMFTEFGNEVDLLVTDVRMNKDQSAVVSAVNYAPERFDATTGAIPSFDSNVTLALGSLPPLAPILDGAVQSDETVMVRNSDGSYMTRMMIPLNNVNEPSVLPIVLIQVLGSTQWSRAEVVTASEELVAITGLQDGTVYNISIRYQRQTGQMLLSAPLLINGVVFVGASSRPADVDNFRMTVSGTTALFDWTPNTDVDLSHYIVRFTRSVSSVAWATSPVVADNVKTNRLALPVQSGTYLIKAVDLADNESVNATSVISYNTGALNNVVETLTQEPSWSGTLTNMAIVGSTIHLDPDRTVPGYYYFDPATTDLTDNYESVLSSLIEGYADIDSGGTIVRTVSSIRSLNSIRGIDSELWSITLQMNKDSAGWEDFTAGTHIFQTIEFRLKVESFDPAVDVIVTNAEVVIDMPDRVEKDTSVACVAAGTTVTYSLPFKNDPAVNITLQDGAVDDSLVFVSKSSSGFTLKVYNATTAGYVDRIFDYASVGYGRVV